MSTEDDAVKSCLNITIKHSSDQITFNDKEVRMDFILAGKSNIYDVKLPETDFRVDAYYHPAQNRKMTDKDVI